MFEVYIYDYVCMLCGCGKKDGVLYEVLVVCFVVIVLEVVCDCNGLDIKKVDDVVFGCVDLVGEVGGDIVCVVVFVVGYDRFVFGMQINCFCVFGFDVVNMVFVQVMVGQYKLVIVGGVESMSWVGIGVLGGVWLIELQVVIFFYFML